MTLDVDMLAKLEGRRSPGRWVHEGRYGGRKYNWPQCRYCGRGQGHDCEPASCLLCGSVQCNDRSECRVCRYGWMPGWWRGGGGEGKACGYKGCDAPAVAKVPLRVRRACTDHAARVKLRLAGRTVPLPEYVAERVAHRDSGKWWEHWRFIELPSRTP